MPEKIVALGLLTDDDLSRLGHNFKRHFPVPQGDAFVELMKKLDEIPSVPALAPEPC